MDLKLLAATTLLLIFCSEVSSFRLKREEAQQKDTLAQAQEVAKHYWDQASGAAHSWFDAVKSMTVYEKARDALEKTSSAFSTYFSILSDQAVHWWQENQ